MFPAYRVYFKRLMVVLSIQALLLVILVGQLVFLQLVNQDKYVGMSNRNRIRVTLEPTLRGALLDRNNEILAKTVPYYTAMVKCNTLDCLDRCHHALKQHNVMFDNRLFEGSKSKEFVLKKDLTWKELSFFEAYKIDFPMIHIQTRFRRTYPMDDLTPHFLGYTSKIPENHPYAKKLPFASVGRSGLEKYLDKTLFGVPNILEEEVNAYRKVVKQLSFVKGKKGDDIRLTIDARVQRFVHEKLKPHKSGAVVVLDIETGGLVALASYPSFNPSVFENGMTQSEWDALRLNEARPLVDKSIMGVYPPGSILKPIIALAALEEGYITHSTRFHCNGVTHIDGQPCHCWKAGGHGSVNLSEALRGSCNVYMYEIAKRVPQDLIVKWLRRFGFGSITSGYIAGESEGLVPTSAWKQKYRKDKWRRIDTVYGAIGQGYMLATPIQMAKMMGQLANGGYELTPTLLFSEALQNKSASQRKIKVSAANLNYIVHALGEVVNNPKGTGYRSRPLNVNWKMAGKSGTAQVRKITQKQRDEGKHHGFDWEWKYKDHSMFAGFAPLKKPKYVVVVVVDHGGFGSVTAAPIGRDVMQYTMGHLLP